MEQNSIDLFEEIFKTPKEHSGTVVEKHLQKLRELDQYLPPTQSFFIVTNTSTQKSVCE
ncbi:MULTISPECIES: hypothetical protein [unclassified Polaribacter]|uniref:hypothetical protein n=1 Tax=unclassified Polaribacter TaxID=196858 RepID=UPI00167A3F48|nr:MULTISPECIES: hypothetical protein [unclassified Polaribacter]